MREGRGRREEGGGRKEQEAGRRVTYQGGAGREKAVKH
jgi:hypothetical protein